MLIYGNIKQNEEVYIMKKILAVLISAILVCTAFSGCKDKKTEEITAETTTETTTEATTTEASSVETTLPADASDSSGYKFDEVIIDTFTSDNPNLNSLVSMSKDKMYYDAISYIISDKNETMECKTIMATKQGGYYYVSSDATGILVNGVITPDDSFVYLPLLQQYQKITAEEMGVDSLKQTLEIFSLLEYIESSNVTVNEDKFIREKYGIQGMNLYYYFTEDGTPVYNYSEADGVKYINKYNAFNGDVDDSLFVLPEGYTEMVQ